MTTSVSAAPLLYETHLHTPLCKHAVGEPEEYAAVAKQRGLKGMIVTCHGPLPDGYSADVRMELAQFDRYLAIVQRARRTWQGRVDVRLGLESDYFPGIEPWLDQLHRRADFHYLIGSVHPQVREYQQRYFRGDWLAFQQTYFEHLALAAETRQFDALGHPDLVKNCAPAHWDYDRLRPHLCRALDRIAATGVALELNTSGLNKAIPEMNPGLSMLREMRLRGIPVVIGSDAHEPGRVADRFPLAIEILRAAGYDTVSFFLHRRRVDIPLAEAAASLAPEPIQTRTYVDTSATHH